MREEDARQHQERRREDADFLLGPPEDGVIRGMSLPEDVLAKVYYQNAARLMSIQIDKDRK